MREEAHRIRLQTHSVGEAKTKTIVFEGHVGGGIYELTVDGERYVWGTVLLWELPERLAFTLASRA